MRKVGTQNRIRVFPASEVTSINTDAEVSPRSVGLDESDVAAVWDAVCRFYSTGLQPAIAISLRRSGQVVLDRAIGHTHGNLPGRFDPAQLRQATPKSLFSLFSASKAVTAMCIHLLDEQQKIHLDDRVCDYIPEFRAHGKEKITIRHILAHKAGIPFVDGVDINLDLLSDPSTLVNILCDAPLVASPGRKLQYHSITGGFILGEIVKRVTGKDIRAYLQKNFARPLGLDQFDFGVPDKLVNDVAPNVTTGMKLIKPVYNAFQRAFGVDFYSAIEMSNDPRFLTAIVPSANIVTTADQACRFFQMLLDNGQANGKQICDPRTIWHATHEQSYGEVDSVILFPFRYSMGFMLGSRRANPYGPRTENAFGHLGFTNVVAWADPDRDISCCIMTPGKPVMDLPVLHWLNIMRTIAKRCR